MCLQVTFGCVTLSAIWNLHLKSILYCVCGSVGLSEAGHNKEFISAFWDTLSTYIVYLVGKFVLWNYNPLTLKQIQFSLNKTIQNSIQLNVIQNHSNISVSKIRGFFSFSNRTSTIYFTLCFSLFVICKNHILHVSLISYSTSLT